MKTPESALDQAGFVISPDDLMCRNILIADGTVTADPDMYDHLLASVATLGSMISGAVIETLDATPQNAPVVEPCRLNLRIGLSNGRTILLHGEWKMCVSIEPAPTQLPEHDE